MFWQQVLLLKKKKKTLTVSKLHSFFPLNICYSRWLTGITAKTAPTAINASHCLTFIVQVSELAPCTHHWMAHFVWSQVCISSIQRCGVCTWLWSSNWNPFMWHTWLPNWSFTDTRRYFSHICTECLQYFFSLKFNVPCFSPQDYEEPLMFFCLNEEDEDDPLQPVCGEDFINFLENLTQMGLFSTNLPLSGF